MRKKKGEDRDMRMAALAVTVENALAEHGVTDTGTFIHNLNAKFLTAEGTGGADVVLRDAWAKFMLADAAINEQGDRYITDGGDVVLAAVANSIIDWAARAVAINRLLDERLNVPDFMRTTEPDKV